MFGFRPKTQTYDEALEVIVKGDAVMQIAYQDVPVAVKNQAGFDHQLYTLFADIAPKNMQSFICGPFGNWDGTSQGIFYDGMVFATARQSFINALQHHRSDDGGRHIWDFLSEYQRCVVTSPLFEKVDYYYITWDDGTKTEYATDKEARQVWDGITVGGRRSMGQSYHVRRKTT